nr:magnesium transporter MRS2-4 [Ipomoea batatas]GMD63562.1 magnesium transporter MRS2-4 [Ipomoea batatas]
MGKGRFSLRRRKKEAVAGTSPRPTRVGEQASGNGSGSLVASSAVTSKPRKKKVVGARLLMRFDRTGQSKLIYKHLWIKKAVILLMLGGVERKLEKWNPFTRCGRTREMYVVHRQYVVRELDDEDSRAGTVQSRFEGIR